MFLLAKLRDFSHVCKYKTAFSAKKAPNSVRWTILYLPQTHFATELHGKSSTFAPEIEKRYSMAHRHQHTSSVGILGLCIGLNLLFVAVEAVVGWFSNSSGLLSDAGHNLSDVLGLVLSLVAILLARRGNSNSQRVSLRVTLANGLLLLLTIGLIVADGVAQILYPKEVNSSAIILTAGVGIAINGLTAWVLTRGGEQDLNIRAAFLHATTDTLVSIGVVAAGVVIYFTGWAVLDPIVSIIISVVILIPTVRLLKDTIANYKNVQ